MTPPSAGHPRHKQVVSGWRALRLWYQFILDPLDFLESGRAVYGAVFAVTRSLPLLHSRRQYIIAIGSEYNQTVLSQPDLYRNTSFTWRGSAKSAQRQIHYGLTRINGEKHRHARQLLKPLFTKPALAESYDAIAAQFDSALAGWSEGQTVDVWKEMRSAAVAISTEMLFGGGHQGRGRKLDRLLLEWIDTTQELSTFLIPFDVPGTRFARLMRVAEQIKATFAEMVAERRRTGRLGSDLLGVLLSEIDQPDSELSETDLYSHATTMFAGSFENIANAVAWTLMLLGQHPNVLAGLMEELHAELDGNTPSLEQLEKLPLLDAVLKESMRILPPAPTMIRAANAETELGGVVVRQDDHILLSAYHTHRNPELFPEPDRFDPGRWFALELAQDGEQIRPGPYEYLPFGAGPRVCIAKTFGWLQIKLMLAMVVQRWRLEAVPGSRVNYRARIVLRPHPGIPMIVRRHDSAPRAVPIGGQVCQLVDFTHPGDRIRSSGPVPRQIETESPNRQLLGRAG